MDNTMQNKVENKIDSARDGITKINRDVRADAHATIDRVADKVPPTADRLAQSAHNGVDKVADTVNRVNTKWDGTVERLSTGTKQLSENAKVWAESLDYAWCAPRIPSGFQVEQEIGFLVNEVIVGTKKPKEALDEAAGKVKAIMEKNGFYKGADPMNYAATEPGLWIGKGKTAPF